MYGKERAIRVSFLRAAVHQSRPRRRKERRTGVKNPATPEKILGEDIEKKKSFPSFLRLLVFTSLGGEWISYLKNI